MTNPATPSDSQRTGDAAAADQPYLAPTFDEKVQRFWKQNGRAIVIMCVVALLIIAGKGFWELNQVRVERQVQDAYLAATTTDKLKAFAAAHPDHVLAGAAELAVADEAYAAGKYSEALAGYEKASTTIKDGPLVSRAKLGVAITKLLTGKTAEAETMLKQISNDATELTTARLEATFHLAVQAAAAGRADEVQKLVEQAGNLEKSPSRQRMSLWQQRFIALLDSLPAEASKEPPDSQLPAITVPGAK